METERSTLDGSSECCGKVTVKLYITATPPSDPKMQCLSATTSSTTFPSSDRWFLQNYSIIDDRHAPYVHNYSILALSYASQGLKKHRIKFVVGLQVSNLSATCVLAHPLYQGSKGVHNNPIAFQNSFNTVP